MRRAQKKIGSPELIPEKPFLLNRKRKKDILVYATGVPRTVWFDVFPYGLEIPHFCVDNRLPACRFCLKAGKKT
jgi:hypothetical protein